MPMTMPESPAGANDAVAEELPDTAAALVESSLESSLEGAAPDDEKISLSIESSTESAHSPQASEQLADMRDVVVPSVLDAEAQLQMRVQMQRLQEQREADKASGGALSLVQPISQHKLSRRCVPGTPFESTVSNEVAQRALKLRCLEVQRTGIRAGPDSS